MFDVLIFYNGTIFSLSDPSPLQDLPTCITWQPGQGHVFGVGSEAGQVVVKDTRFAVCSTVSYTPHRRAVKRLQFSPVK